MGNSWLLAGATAGMHVRIGAPGGYLPDAASSSAAAAIAADTGGSVTLHDDPAAAVAGADAVVTDTWVSMGKEEEAAERRGLRAVLARRASCSPTPRRTRWCCTACRPTGARRSRPR